MTCVGQVVLLVLVATAAYTQAARTTADVDVDQEGQQQEVNAEGSPVTRDDFVLAHILHHGSFRRPELMARLDLSEERHGVLPTHRGVAHHHRRHLRRSMVMNERVQAVPDPTDKNTVLQLAEMSFNAYEDYNDSDDWKVISGFNITGVDNWVADSMRAYVFVNSDRSIAVIAIKGTSLTFLGIGGPTSDKDLIMDNLMFSCCCARINPIWTTVCDCYIDGGDTCSQPCLENTVQANNTLSYYTMALDLYAVAKRDYPSASFWFTGHSLGGSVAAIVGHDVGCPVFGYEAPGELLYGKRLGLSINDRDMGAYPIYHFGNEADPIFLGTCNGASTCTVSGYAMETGCHIGNVCVYDNDAVTNVNEHRISVVIEKHIIPKSVPRCIPQNDCRDCGDWVFRS